MRKILLSIFVAFLLTFTVSDASIMIMRTRGGSCDDCSGDLKFSWHMENTNIETGTPCGCVDASGDTDAATGDGTPSISGTQYSDGSNSALFATGAEYYAFTVASADIVDKDEGKIVIDIYVDTFVAFATILRATNGSNYFQIVLRNNASNIEIRGHYNGANTTITGASNFTEDEWLRVTYQWKVSASNADHRIEMCELTPPDTTANCIATTAEDDVTVLTAEPTSLHIGILGIQAADIYIDNLEIYATSGL